MTAIIMFDSLAAAISPVFDRVYVVSLPGSADRRAHVRAHFEQIGLTTFSFFDAVGADSPLVADAFASGRVHPYPPCFRCGKDSCGKDDCNNVLIPPQVANYLTYHRLWLEIAAQPQRALVVEDDVLFQPDAAQTLNMLGEAAADLSFRAEISRLLRLGWALGPDHVAGASFRITAEVRMSNPCFGLTSAYAQALVDRHRRIDTTSDLYMHALAPCKGEAFTVFPPLASELSWSTGGVASLIHPKPIRSEFLRKRGDEAGAADNDRRLRDHVKHRAPRDEAASHQFPVTSARRWKSSQAFSQAWSERNEAMLALFVDLIGRTGPFRFTEYGCGPHTPFSVAVATAGCGETVRYDLNVWEHGNRTIDLNALPFDVETTDVGVLSGVLEYLNDATRTLAVLRGAHSYLLVSYAIMPNKALMADEDHVSMLNERCATHGWRNHLDLSELTRLLSKLGYLEGIRFHGRQVIAVVNTVNDLERTGGAGPGRT